MIRPAAMGLAAALWLSAGAVRAGSPTDPVNVAQQMETALNSGNVEAFLAWFAPQSRIVERGGATYATKEAMREWAQALVAHNYRATPGPHTHAGGKVTWVAKVEFDDLRALGVLSVDSRGEATIVDGKVVSFTPAFSPGAMALLGTAAARLLEERVRAYIDAAFTQGRPAAADDFYAPELVDHNPLPGGYPSLEGLRVGVAALRDAFPDLTATVEDVIPAGDRVAARVTYAGTHKGPYLGVQATFRRISFTAVDVFRMKDGKCVEHWCQIDLAGLNQQVGASDSAVTGSAAAPAPRGTKKKNNGILGWLF